MHATVFNSSTGLSHDSVLCPRISASSKKLFPLLIRVVVNCLRIECRIDSAQQYNDVGIPITDAADLEVIAVDIENLQSILEDVDFAELAEFPARTLEEFECRIDRPGGEFMR